MLKNRIFRGLYLKNWGLLKPKNLQSFATVCIELNSIIYIELNSESGSRWLFFGSNVCLSLSNDVKSN